MKLDSMITKMRIFRKAVIEGSHQNIQMLYQVPSVHNCSNPQFIDKGYYRRHNGEYCIYQEAQKEKADFRLLECTACHNEFYLMNSGAKNWDMSSIQENNKQKIKS